ncbi:MAG: hypothetical protein ABIN54_10535 [candidate division WOR-3 bacterium]
MRVKISLEFTGNFWIDNGKIQLKRLLGLENGQEIELQETVDRLVNEYLVKPTGNRKEFYNSLTGKLQSYEKKNWVSPADVFIKVTPKTKTKAGKTQKYTCMVDGKKKEFEIWEHPPLYQIKIKVTRKGPCIFCGDNNALVALKQYIYPFLVEPSKFSNFYPSLDTPYHSCPVCALAGMAAYLGTLYRRHDNNLHMFLFHSDDLGFLSQFLDAIRPIIASEELKSKATNFPADFSGEGLHETMLGFLFYVFSKLYEKETSAQVEEVFFSLLGQEKSAQAHLILVGISGQANKGFNMTGFTEFSKLEPLYRLYRSWRTRGVDPSPIIKQFMTKEGKSRNSIWREQVALGITEFSEIAQSIEDFIYNARAKEDNPYPIKDLSQFLGIYHQEVLKMDEDTIKLLAGFGHSLGNKCREANEMGLLYSLRNAKNIDDYLKIINDIQFRLEMTAPEALIRIEKGERIAGQPWQRIKTLLSIYAMNSFLWKGSDKKEENK